MRETLVKGKHHVALLLIAVGAAGAPPAQAQGTPWRPIERAELCVTDGSIEHTADHMTIDGPQVRATVRSATPQFAEIRFTYLGPSAVTAPLGSGLERHQIGLKLRAQDSCNVVYAMWHIEADQRIAIATKRNAGKHTHAQCGNRGYQITATSTQALPLAIGGAHTLRATLRAEVVEVYADNTLALTTKLDPRRLDFDGPVGMRTDNGRFQFQYFVGGPGPGPLSRPLDQNTNRCH